MTTIENTRLDNMEEKLKAVEDKVDRILIALTGDDLQVSSGFIAEFKNLKERVRSLEAVKNKIVWISIGAGVAGGLSLNKAIEVLQEVIK